MRMVVARLEIALAAMALVSTAALAAVPIQPDKDNVVGSRLAGTWRLHADLTTRLRGKASRAAVVTFQVSSASSIMLRPAYEKFLAKKTVFVSGTMTKGGKDYPFILSEYKGNPHVFYFREKDGDPMGDGESFNVMLAVARDTKNDLLFIGGDFNNQPFAAYERVE